MSRSSNISRTGWIVGGVIAALLLVPTTAVAVTATTTIIQSGTAAGQAIVTAHRLQTNDEIKGYSGNNYAGVSSDNQLLTTTTVPDTFVNSSATGLGTGAAQPLVSPPSGNAMVVTTIHLTTAYVSTPGVGEGIFLLIESGTTCQSGVQAGSYTEWVFPDSVGETDIPFNPGLAIPAGDALCSIEQGDIQGFATVTGYLVSSNEVPQGPLHRVPKLPHH